MTSMTTTSRTLLSVINQHPYLINKRVILPVILSVLLGLSATREVTIAVLADAYFQVAAFVYASLALYYLATLRISAEAISRFMNQHPVYEVGLAACLGALPGCGGAIIVVTQYTKGVTSFGAVVAVLTSTMGDAAFLLLAQSPIDGLTVMAVGVVVGSLTGLVVNKFHNYKPSDTLKDTVVSETSLSSESEANLSLGDNVKRASIKFWMAVAIPSLAIALGIALQLPVHQDLGISAKSLGYIGATLCFIGISLWAFSGSSTGYASITKEEAISPPVSWQEKSALDTQFVLAWVVVAFLLFELSILWFAIDITQLFQGMGLGLVALAIVIGFLPGCGPQILVTTLYLNGAIPFSAQLGNAISNDGDALFPAIALSPKAAMLATFYSALPAFIVGYGYYFLFE